jgi:hypothetical protein
MDTRTWTDDQLRSAVASSTTWKDVARKLGLVQSSTPRLKRHARRLDLNVSHFTGKRRWSDSDLRSAVEACATWEELLERLGIGDTSETRVYVKGHAVRLGIDLAHLNGGMLPAEVQDQLVQAPDLSRRLRVAAESIAIAWLSLRGIPVAVPSEPCKYDLLVTLGSGVKRVQVKSGCFRQKQGTWMVRVGHRPYVQDKSASRIPYDPDDVDYFFLIDGDGALYFIPSTALAGKTTINVGAYSQYRVGDASSLFEVAA